MGRHLTRDEVLAIRRLGVTDKASKISEGLGISYNTVRLVLAGETWKSIPWEPGTAPGDGLGRRRLTRDEVLAIRRLGVTDKASKISEDLGISCQTVRLVLTGESWKSIPWEPGTAPGPRLSDRRPRPTQHSGDGEWRRVPNVQVEATAQGELRRLPDLRVYPEVTFDSRIRVVLDCGGSAQLSAALLVAYAFIGPRPLGCILRLIDESGPLTPNNMHYVARSA